MSFYFSLSQQTDFSEATAATPAKSTTSSSSAIAKETPAKSTNKEVKVCPNCAGLSFYTDPTTLQLTCNSCYTQLQSSTNEELDATDGLGIAAQFGNKHLSRTSNIGGSGSSRGSSRPKRPLIEYDSSKTLPSVEACISAFQWLLWDASKCISKLIGIHEYQQPISMNPDLIIFDYKDATDKYSPTIFEQTVKQIWFTYLKVWTTATQEYTKKYPELRISYRDYFLEDIRKAYILKHLSISIGKCVEDELLGSLQEMYDTDHEFDDYDYDEEDSISSCGSSIASYSDIDDENWDSSDAESISSSSSYNKKRRLHHISSSRPFLTIAQMYKAVIPRNNKQKHSNGLYKNMHPYHAVLSIQPSLTLLLSILQLACNHLQTGIASHHITHWVSNGQLPHGINGYRLLPTKLKEGVGLGKNFFMRSFVPPANDIADMTSLLATVCGWYDDASTDTSSQDGDEGVKDEADELTPSNNVKGEISILPDTIHSSSAASASSSISSPDNSVTSSIKSSDSVNSPQQQQSNEQHQTSLYNVPVLAARLVQDFGFDQAVLNNTLALMGLSNDGKPSQICVANHKQEYSSSDDEESTSDNQNQDRSSLSSVPQLDCASPDNLYSPLHVAAVIVIACKLCPGWESWKIVNLHHTARSRAKKRKGSKRKRKQQSFVPWNESQFQLLGNGSTLNNYMNFLEETAFSELEQPSEKASMFFNKLKDKSCTQPKDTSPPKRKKRRLKVKPNTILSGADNPNTPTDTSLPSYVQYHTANNIGRYTSYQYRMYGDEKILSTEPYHPHYCRMLEYICYIMEEPCTAKLHDLVVEYESELLMYHLDDDDDDDDSVISEL